MRQKYGNTKYKGCDSKKEYYRLNELKLLERAGEISNLETQVKFELIPAQYEDVEVVMKTKIKTVKVCIERACHYIADFQYVDKEGNTVVEDTKSDPTKTPEYLIKKKLMYLNYGIKIKEV